MSNLKKFAAFFCAAAAVTCAGTALASTAANTRIINQATLSYNDGSANKTATAAVTVTVSLVPASPNIALGPNQSTSYTGPATTVQNTFIVTNSSNGPDTFTLASAITGSTNTNNGTAPSAAVTSPGGNLALGGSITVAGSSTTVINVPSDGVSGNAVNGITGGSTVVISGEARTVSSVANTGSGVATITLGAALGSAPIAGIVVGEQKTVTVTVSAGAIQVSGTDITVQKNLTVTSTHATLANPATLTSGSITDTFTSGVASLTKFVRNVTSGQVGTTKLTHNGADYYQADITAKPNDVLEYILVASNSGSAPVTVATVTDILPTAYVSLKTGVYGGKDIAYESETGVVTDLTVANDGDNGNFNAGQSKITVYVGTGATNAAGGAIAAGKSVYVYYQTLVNP